jgi:hypothetical protein
MHGEKSGTVRLQRIDGHLKEGTQGEFLSRISTLTRLDSGSLRVEEIATIRVLPWGWRQKSGMPQAVRALLRKGA